MQEEARVHPGVHEAQGRAHLYWSQLRDLQPTSARTCGLRCPHGCRASHRAFFAGCYTFFFHSFWHPIFCQHQITLGVSQTFVTVPPFTMRLSVPNQNLPCRRLNRRTWHLLQLLLPSRLLQLQLRPQVLLPPRLGDRSDIFIFVFSSSL